MPSRLTSVLHMRADTISALSGVRGKYDGQIAVIDGHTTRGDGGGGEFYWDADDTTTADGGTILGTGTGRWKRNYSGAVNVKWFGATGNGTTDDTAAFLAAIAMFPTGSGRIHVPKGRYKITSTLSISQDRIWISGDGPNTSEVIFAPSTGDILFDFSDGSNVLYECALTDLSIWSDDVTNSNVAIKLIDTSKFRLENVKVAGSDTGVALFWKGTALQTCGRELSVFRNITLAATYPIRISENPNGGIYQLACDHFHFEDTYLLANAQPCVTIDDGVFVTNLTFDGHQAWAGGSYGLYWSNTTEVYAHQSVTFKNVRNEQGSGTTGYTFYVSSTSQIQELSFDNCQLAIEYNGWYLRGTNRVSVSNCLYGATSGSLKVLDIVGDANSTIEWRSNQIAYGCSASIVDMRQVSASPTYGLSGMPHSAYYAYLHTGGNDQYPLSNGARDMCWTGTLADDAQVDLFCWSGTTAKISHIDVAAISGTTRAGGSAIGSHVGGTNTVHLISGTADFDVADTDTKMCVYTGGSQIYLKNRLGASCTYVARVMWGA